MSLIIGSDTLESLWDEIIYLVGIKTDDILGMTAYQGSTIEDMVQYLDEKHYPGILKSWSTEYVYKEAKKLLEESLTLQEAGSALLDPKIFFTSTKEENLRTMITEYFSDKINMESPQHVIRAMIAFIELSLEDYHRAATEAGFARNEKDVPNFKEHLDNRDEDAKKAMLKTEKTKAEIFLEKLSEFRFNTEKFECAG